MSPPRDADLGGMGNKEVMIGPRLKRNLMMTPHKAFRLHRFHFLRPILLVGIFAAATLGSGQNAPSTTSSAKAAAPAGSPNHYSPNRMPHRETKIPSPALTASVSPPSLPPRPHNVHPTP